MVRKQKRGSGRKDGDPGKVAQNEALKILLSASMDAYLSPSAGPDRTHWPHMLRLPDHFADLDHYRHAFTPALLDEARASVASGLRSRPSQFFDFKRFFCFCFKPAALACDGGGQARPVPAQFI